MYGKDRSPALKWRITRKLKKFQICVFKRNTPAGNFVLLLTTIGRKTGLERITPLQYEYQDGLVYIASARGQAADWFRNIRADPRVKIKIKGRQRWALAEPVIDPERIADFLEVRLHKHPIMVRLIMTFAGLPLKFNREDLVQYSAGRAMVIIHTDENKMAHSND